LRDLLLKGEEGRGGEGEREMKGKGKGARGKRGGEREGTSTSFSPLPALIVGVDFCRYGESTPNTT